MITGAHIIICSKEAEADRAFFRGIFRMWMWVMAGCISTSAGRAPPRKHESGMIKSTPSKISSQGTDWRFFNELKRELKS